MKSLKHITIILLAFFMLQNCNSGKKNNIAQVYQCPMQCEVAKTYDEPGSCPVCKMDLQPVATSSSEKMVDDNKISEASIFNLTSAWHTEENETIKLDNLKGKTLVMVMIYTSCKAACPRLVADMRNIESKLPDDKIENIQFIMVSIDPETDTPEKLKAFAIENEMDGEQWTFLQGTESGVREFANVLSVKYKEISPIDFSHSNIISVFNALGELVHQQEGLGVDNQATIESILKVTP